jgi:hypothetical protein
LSCPRKRDRGGPDLLPRGRDNASRLTVFTACLHTHARAGVCTSESSARDRARGSGGSCPEVRLLTGIWPHVIEAANVVDAPAYERTTKNP